MSGKKYFDKSSYLSLTEESTMYSQNYSVQDLIEKIFLHCNGVS